MAADILVPVSIYIRSFQCMAISMLKIRRSRDRLIFNMGIHILVRRHFYIATPPIVTQGVGASAAMSLIYFSRNSSCSVPVGYIQIIFNRQWRLTYIYLTGLWHPLYINNTLGNLLFIASIQNRIRTVITFYVDISCSNNRNTQLCLGTKMSHIITSWVKVISRGIHLITWMKNGQTRCLINMEL